MNDALPSIELNHVRITRGATLVIPDLDLHVVGPTWFGLVGANGSGKTTLLRAIAGRLLHDRGQICINSTDLSADRAARAGLIGFAVDPSMLPRELTPREVIALADPKPGLWNEAALKPLAEALKLDTLLDRRCKTLSAGNLQRVAIYSAFLGLPKCIILDEPFNWLDPVVTVDLKDALSQLVNSTGTLLITALHDLATLTTRCDQAGLLSQGRLVRLFNQDDLHQAQSDSIDFEREIASILR
jgi:ABC-2 type transport system ATP-binding protein